MENTNGRDDDWDDAKFSEADSNFPEGDVIDYQGPKQDFGWGDATQERKK